MSVQVIGFLILWLGTFCFYMLVGSVVAAAYKDETSTSVFVFMAMFWPVILSIIVLKGFKEFVKEMK